MIPTTTTTPASNQVILPPGDYVSPNLEVVRLDDAFPDMIVGNPQTPEWPYLRREISHNWYVDRRNPTVGFLSRDEVSIIYNSARMFQGLPCLEIGCWRGWSTAHFALGANGLEVVDPVLQNSEFRKDVMASLRRAGVLDRVVLHEGASPEEVKRISAGKGKRWSMVFIDGDHEGDAPRLDAETVERCAADDALIIFHDLVSPDVAAGLSYLRSQGWKTAIYQTMQIMGVAVRGAVRPIAHVPDPTQAWTVPTHLASFSVIGESRLTRVFRIASQLAGCQLSPDLPECDQGPLDALPDREAEALDSLLIQAGTVVDSIGPGGLVAGSEATRAFDELQQQHLRLLDKLLELESSLPRAELEQLRLKHIDLVTRLSEVAFARDLLEDQLADSQRSQEAMANELRDIEQLRLKHIDVVTRLSEVAFARDLLEDQLAASQRSQEATASDLRDIMQERDIFGRLLDRANAKVAEVEQARASAERLLDRANAKVAEVEQARASAELARTQTVAEFSQVQIEIEVETRRQSLQGPAAYAAIRQFSYWIARKRILFGLTRRVLAGRTAQVRSIIEQSLRTHGVVTPIMDTAVGWLSHPRIILGLARRRALAGMSAVQGLVMLMLERDLLAAAATIRPISIEPLVGLQLRKLNDMNTDLQRRLEVEAQLLGAERERFQALETAKLEDERALLYTQQRLEAERERFQALETAKLEDERALLHAQLTIAQLRAPIAASTT